MPSKKRLRWQDTDYTDSPLLEYVIGCHSVQTAGLIPEIFAQRQAKGAAKTSTKPGGLARIGGAATGYRSRN